MKELNKIKIKLVEKHRTSKWLAAELGMSATTISRWCQQKAQPDLNVLNRIALLLQCEMKDLVGDGNNI